MEERTGLDPFTRKYLLALLALAALLLIWWVSGLDSRISALNTMLRSDPQLAAYSYTFEVISLKDGAAEMSSPYLD